MMANAQGTTAGTQAVRSGPRGETRTEAIATPHILIVDDEPMILKLMESMLDRAGFQVKTAQSEPQAIEAVRGNGAVMLAILDWCMPGTSGERVLDRLSTERPDLKFIVASGEDLEDVRQAFWGRNVGCFVKKPFENGALVAAVKSALTA